MSAGPSWIRVIIGGSPAGPPGPLAQDSDRDGDSEPESERGSHGDSGVQVRWDSESEAVGNLNGHGSESPAGR